MLNKCLTYPAWNLIPPVQDQLSYLYSLSPIAVGTAEVESLTSYIARLAAEHRVSIKTLFNQELAVFRQTALNAQDTEQATRRRQDSLASIIPLNGSTANVSKVVQILEAATLQQDLKYLTLLTWKNVIPPTALLRRSEAWCPYCYEQWRSNGQVLYKPLLWQINVVTVCPYHQRPLRLQCSYCGQHSYLFMRDSQPGHCPQCHQWLGRSWDTEISTQPESSEQNAEWELWGACQVANLLAVANKLDFLPQRQQIAQSLNSCISQVAPNNRATFARIMNLPPILLGSWCSGRFIPKLQTVLNICYQLRIPLSEFLLKDTLQVPPERIAMLVKPQTKAQRKKPEKRLTATDVIVTMQQALQEYPPPSALQVAQRLGYQTTGGLRWHAPDLLKTLAARYAKYTKALYLEALKEGIESALIASNLDPLSVKELAQQLGCSSSTLYEHFPNECYALAARYLSNRHTHSQQKMEQRCRNVQNAVFHLNSEGAYPSARKVFALLQQPGILKLPEVRDAFHKARRQLGIEIEGEKLTLTSTDNSLKLLSKENMH
jgi:AraC-like DNA-binding protein